MPNQKAPLAWVVVAVLFFAGALLVLQPYRADWPGTEYGDPVRRYLRTAIRQDSVGLARLSASPAPVRWALASARNEPGTLALWGGRIQAWAGPRHGDTTEVFVYPPGDRCGETPIVLRVVGQGERMRVVAAESECFR